MSFEMSDSLKENNPVISSNINKVATGMASFYLQFGISNIEPQYKKQFDQLYHEVAFMLLQVLHLLSHYYY